MNKNTFVLKNEETNKTLAFLLSLEMYHKEDNCVIMCSEEEKNYILAFPKKINLNLDFYIIKHTENIYGTFSRFFVDFINILEYSVDKYKSIYYLENNFICFNKFEISEELQNEDFVFLKRNVDFEDKKKTLKYNFSFVYLKNKKFIELLKTKMSDFFDTDINVAINEYLEKLEIKFLEEKEKEQKEEEEEENKTINDKNLAIKFSKLPFEIADTTKCKCLNDNSFLFFGDFFAYGNEKSLKNIDASFNYVVDLSNNVVDLSNNVVDLSNNVVDLSNNVNKICFFNCVLTKVIVSNPYLKNHVTTITNLLSKRDLYNSFIINLYYSNKVYFDFPTIKGVGIWDRTKDTSFYQLLNYCVKKYSDYFGKKEMFVDYFSLYSTFMLMDKSSYIFLNNSICNYKKIYLCNYDKSLLSKLDEIPRETKFLFYVTYYPKQLEEILEQRDIVRNLTEKTEDVVEVDCFQNTFSLKHLHKEANGSEEKLEFSDFIHALLKSKYALIKKFDVKMVATCLALGVVPIFDQDNLYELDEGVHYIKHVNDIDDTKYAVLKENGVNYYESSVRPEKAIERLLEDIFVR
jgi:hypothetical protein